MKTMLILGGGTAGTMTANKLAHRLNPEEWRIMLVDRDEEHLYQPGLLFIPFGVYRTKDVLRPKRRLIDARVQVIFSDIDLIVPESDRIELSNGQRVTYDTLVIATGCQIRPDQIDGMMDGGWQENIFDFYTLDGATALNRFLQTWQGGRLVVNVAEMPIKCPVAPLEFLFLADWYFTQRGLRDRVDIVYATPLSGAFTKPQASSALGEMLASKGIQVETDFNINKVDGGKQSVTSWDGRELPYDLLVTVPTNMGSEAIERSHLGDELNFVPTDKYTLQSKGYENIWVIGDAANVPASKAGSVTHFMLDTLVENIERQIDRQPPLPSFDGHANCFIETGFNRGVMIDFNYDVEPLRGHYPLPHLGPFSLLKESRANHLGKLSFKWIYWNILLPGRPMPLSNKLSMAGKIN